MVIGGVVLCTASSSGIKRDEKTYFFSVIVVAALNVHGLYVLCGWYMVCPFGQGAILWVR
jgi:hypothetical protein